MNVGKLSLDNLEKYGEYTSLHYGGHDFTNLQEANSAAAMASVLREHNVGVNDRVVVMMPNSPEVTRAFQAVWKLGAAIIPVTPQLGAKEVRYMLEDSAASHIITSPLLADRVAEASDGIQTVKQMMVLGESAAKGAIDISGEVQQAAGNMRLEQLADRSGDDMALLLYTSGTTGQPKGVILSHNNLSSNAISVSGMDPTIGPQERNLHVLPLSHSFGVLMMNLGYIMGSVSALMSHFDLEVVFQQLDKYKIERMAGVPTMLTYMLNFPDRAKYDTSHLKEMSTGGAALPNEVRLAFQKEFDCRVMDGYGMSECAPSATGYYGGDEYRPGSVGRAIPEVDVRIHDANDEPVEPGVWGEICMRGPNVMSGYLNKPEATAEALANGWLHSGDIGYMDEDGFVFITDRKKDLVIKGGENISPREIEEAIYEHPAVAEVAIIGLPHETYGEDVVAVVSLKPGHEADEQDIRTQAAQAVTKFKVPGKVFFVDDLPKSGIGKILKRELRDRFKDS